MFGFCEDAGRAGYPAGMRMLNPVAVLIRDISWTRQFRSVRAAILKGFWRLRALLPGGRMEHITIQTRSLLSGQLNEMVLFVDQDALERWLEARPGQKRFIQDEFPHLSDDEREFLLTGSTPDEWERYFGEEK